MGEIALSRMRGDASAASDGSCRRQFDPRVCCNTVGGICCCCCCCLPRPDNVAATKTSDDGGRLLEDDDECFRGGGRVDVAPLVGWDCKIE